MTRNRNFQLAFMRARAKQQKGAWNRRMLAIVRTQRMWRRKLKARGRLRGRPVRRRGYHRVRVRSRWRTVPFDHTWHVYPKIWRLRYKR